MRKLAPYCNNFKKVDVRICVHCVSCSDKFVSLHRLLNGTAGLIHPWCHVWPECKHICGCLRGNASTSRLDGLGVVTSSEHEIDPKAAIKTWFPDVYSLPHFMSIPEFRRSTCMLQGIGFAASIALCWNQRSVAPFVALLRIDVEQGCSKNNGHQQSVCKYELCSFVRQHHTTLGMPVH